VLARESRGAAAVQRWHGRQKRSRARHRRNREALTGGARERERGRGLTGGARVENKRISKFSKSSKKSKNPKNGLEKIKILEKSAEISGSRLTHLEQLLLLILCLILYEIQNVHEV
jgi:hypothetical protein